MASEAPDVKPNMSKWPLPTEKTKDLRSDDMSKVKTIAGGTLGPRAGNNSDAGKKPNESLR